MVHVEGGIDTSNDAVFTLVLDVLDRKKETHTSLVLTPQDLLFVLVSFSRYGFIFLSRFILDSIRTKNTPIHRTLVWSMLRGGVDTTNHQKGY